MTLRKGSISFTRYFTNPKEELTEEFVETAIKNLNDFYKFTNDNLDHRKTEAYGFKAKRGIFDASNISIEENGKADTLRLYFRTDSLSIQKDILEDYIAKVKKENGMEKMPTTLEIKHQAMDEYYGKLHPKTKIYEIMWDFHTGEVYFFGTTKKVLDKFTSMFENATGLRLISSDAISNSARLLTEELAKKSIEENPSILVTF